MKAGRPRKLNVIRDSSGKSRGERNTVSAEVRAVRERHLIAEGINPSEALNALAGFTLGKLLLRGRADKTDPGSISQAQYDAGEEWARIVHRHAAIQGFKLSTPSPSFIMVANGMAHGAEFDEDYVARTRRQYTECYDALAAASRTHGPRIQIVTYGCAVENWPVGVLTVRDYGHLRTGLNALAKVL